MLALYLGPRQRPMHDDLPALPTIPPGLYRHYKGQRYEVRWPPPAIQ